MSDSEVEATVAAIWRIESPKLIAALARMLGGDVGQAEDLAQDAFVAALSQWPHEGVPRNPAAWLMTTAKRRAIDAFRREKTLREKSDALQRNAVAGVEPDFSATYEEIDDDLLRLMFVACHPVISKEARVTLTLKLLGGLTTPEIARAFLATEPAIAQRIVRAKRTLSEAGVPFELPGPGERRERLSSVLEVVYLVFNEGYSATSGEDVLRPELVEDALRLGRMLGKLMPREADVQGLIALMELHASRMPARLGPDGEHVLLLDQDRSKWNRLLISRGLAALDRARGLGPFGQYGLQAAIAACHARAATSRETDWAAIAALYDALAQLVPTPVVELNRGVAVGMAFGPQAGLEIVEPLRDEPSLRSYHLLPSVFGDFFFKLGRFAEARAEFERAAEMAQNERDRELLRKRASLCL